jgi:hypothetical protein
MAQTIRLADKKQELPASRKQVTPEALQRELNYWRSRKILDGMLNKGLISPDEHKKIDALNRQSFCPALAELMV